MLQTLQLLSLLALPLNIAAVLDEDLGTLDELLPTRRDVRQLALQRGHPLGQL